MRAAFGPVIDAGEHRVLVIEIIVEDRDERRSEGKVLFKWASALHLQRDFGDSVRKENFRAVRFVGLRSPVVSHGNSVGL